MDRKPTNRQLRAMETKKKIMEAAKILISAKGFENISIEEIAKAASVSTGSFYTYFKRKEDVVEELNRTDFYRLAEIVNAMPDADILQRLRRYCKGFLGEIERTGIEICRQWTKNNLSPTSMLPCGEEITKYEHDYRAMQSILSEGISRGELRADLPLDDLALAFNAALYGLMVAWCMTDGGVVGSERADALCDTVIKAALEPYRQ
ncbi:MAG: TetR/AcrR family transcriptional regulator [Oscillospiraceae bacterium]|nr:TetR/AcrR family transcriptional regulator [Oscillospiraceae bacterium]